MTEASAGTTRRRAAVLAASALLAVVLIVQPWLELPRRVRVIVRTAPLELARRRLGGSGTAFDREYFVFLENARRRLPDGTLGVGLYGTPGTEPYTYLAGYVFAPRPVHLAPDPLPEGWVGAIYGTARPPGVRILQDWGPGTLAVERR